MDTKGGQFTLSIGSSTFSGRGAAKIMLSNISVSTAANQDGTAYRTIAPKLVGLDLSFDRGVGVLWDSTMLLQSVDVTFVETDVSVTHLFTSASWDGDPTIDSASGEVTGLKILTDQYQSISS